MRKFKDFLKNRVDKFVWKKNDVQHHTDDKPKEDRSDKFTWKHSDLEHHGVVKESLDEKFKLPADSKGNFHNPQEIRHGEHSYKHPFKKSFKPDEGDESHTAFVEHHDNLDADEKDSLSHYKSSGYKSINKHLRTAHKKFKEVRDKHFKKLKAATSGLQFKDEPQSHKKLKLAIAGHKIEPRRRDEEPSDAEMEEHHLDDHIHHLDNITNHRTVEHHTVFRGGQPGDSTKFPVGHEFTDHGYISTSFRPATARFFADRHPTGKHQIQKNHVHVIHVPKGSRGHFFDVHGDQSDHNNSSENEFVLQRGTRFKVTHHSEDDTNRYIHSRVVKQGIRHKFKFEKKQGAEPKPKDDHGLPGQNKFPFMKHHDRFKKSK